MSGISTDHVCKSFRAQAVLDDLSFVAPAGKVTLLAGLNGAGKTTWIRTALGLTRARSGQIRFDGQSVGIVRDRVGVVFDEPPVYPMMSGRDNLMVLSGGVSVRDAEARGILSMLALTPEFLNMRAREYSLGQRRRLATAVALLRRPSYLFLDEPTIGLDASSWEMVRACLQRLADSGGTIVLTGQDFTSLGPVVEHAVVLHDGRALFEGSVDSLTGIRPRRVWIETATLDPVLEANGFTFSARADGRFERECATTGDAEQMLAVIRSGSVPCTAMGIRQDSLEEAFLSLVQTDPRR